MLIRLIAWCASAALLTASVSGQGLAWRSAAELPAFDVASVRVNRSADTPRASSRFVAEGYQASNITARALIRAAYALTINEQIRGGPDWIDSTRFDIQAKASSADTPRMRLMLQRLMIERFSLAARSELTDLPVFALGMSRADRRLGPGLREMGKSCTPPPESAQPGVAQLQCGQVVFGSGLFWARGISMQRFAEVLSTSRSFTGVERLVVDRTALDDLYMIELTFLQPDALGLLKSTSDDFPELGTALREQLGLKLDGGRAPVNSLIIQDIRPPEPN